MLYSRDIFIPYEKFKLKKHKEIGIENIIYLEKDIPKNVYYTKKSVDIDKKYNNIKELLSLKDFFEKYGKFFKPFNKKSLSQIVYTKTKAFVSFGYMQDKESIVFEDFLLELKENKLIIYGFGTSVGCTTPVKPVLTKEKN